MYVCPLCNQLNNIEVKCSYCQENMDDKGKVIDYFDDYSAYLDIEGMKLFDGYSMDKQEHKCPHVFYCNHCNEEKVLLIAEYKL